jgi:uncharacterized protein (DUF697 family)
MLGKNKKRDVAVRTCGVPMSDEEIAYAAGRASRLVTKRALISAGVSVLPLPGVDVAVDIGVMASILTAVNREFGLTPEQIEALPTEDRLRTFSVIALAGSTLAGKIITPALVGAVIRKVGIQLSAKQAAKWVPIVGSAFSASVSFGALKWLGQQHIRDCAVIARTISRLKLEQAASPETAEQETPRA